MDVSSILEPIKRVYFGIEDAYYGFLDRVNEAIPVYKVIDPIDQFVPSLMLFFVLFLLLVGGGTWLVLNPSTPAAGDDDTGTINAIGDALGGERTGNLQAPPNPSSPPRNRNGSSDNDLPPVPDSPVSKSILLIFKRSTDNELIVSTQIFFSALCTPRGSLPTQSTTNGSISIDMPSTCRTANILISANGYEDHYETLAFTEIDYENKTIELDPEQLPPPNLFHLRVSVIDSGEDALSNVLVRVFKFEQTTLIPQGEQTTQADGRAVFSLAPGNFRVSAFHSESGAMAFSDVNITNADANITMELDTTASNRGVFIRIVSAGSTVGVSEAQVEIYLGTQLLFSGLTDESGEVFQPVQTEDSTQSLYAVIRKSGFLVRTAEISFTSATAPVPTIITLTPATVANASHIRVRVEDTSTKAAIEHAHVVIFAMPEQIPLFAAGIETGPDGNVLFENLTPGTFDLFFLHPAFEQSHLGGIAATAGSTRFLTHGMAPAKGGFLVTIRDADTGNPIQGALVRMRDGLSGDVVRSHDSNSGGSVFFGNLPVNRQVYFEVSKTDYLPLNSALFSPIANQTQEVVFSVTRVSDAGTTPQLVLERLLNADRTVARRFEAGKTYWVQFRMVLPYSQQVFTGLQTYFQDNSSDLGIENLSMFILANQASFSQNASTDPFVGVPPFTGANTGARQLNVQWADQTSSETVLQLQIFVPQEATRNQTLRFGLKTFDPVTQSYVMQEDSKTWRLGEVLCTVNCPGLEDIEWVVKMGLAGDAPQAIDAAVPMNITVNTPYDMEFEVFNFQNTRIDVSSIELSGPALFRAGYQTPAILPFTIDPNQLSSSTILPGQSVRTTVPIRLIADATSNQADLRFRIVSSSPVGSGNPFSVPFKINGSNQLGIEVSIDPANQQIRVLVTDAQAQQPVNLATVKFKKNAGSEGVEITSPDETVTTGQNGIAILNQSLSPGDFGMVQVNATGYATIWERVTSDQAVLGGASAAFSCLNIMTWAPWDDPSIQVTEPLPALAIGTAAPQTGNIVLNAGNCAFDMEFQPVVFFNLFGQSDLNPFSPQTPQVLLRGGTGEFSVSVMPQQKPGVLPVAIMVRRTGETEWKLFDVVDVYLLDAAADIDLYEAG